MIRKIGLGLLAILIIIQFFRPQRNDSNDQTNDVTKTYEVRPDLAGILEVACNDCHTNKTRYPWYANIQPVAWWMSDHIDEGKHHLNLSSFINAPIAVQNHRFKEIAEQVEKGEMPLPSYTWLGMHADARLSEDQKNMIIDWAHQQMDILKLTYPPDSLVLKRRPGPGRED
jgi:lysozyme family protein